MEECLKKGVFFFFGREKALDRKALLVGDMKITSKRNSIRVLGKTMLIVKTRNRQQ